MIVVIDKKNFRVKFKSGMEVPVELFMVSMVIKVYGINAIGLFICLYFATLFINNVTILNTVLRFSLTV